MKSKNQQSVTPTLEQQLARVFGLGLSAAILCLAIGVVIRPVVWLGIAALVLVPLIGATLVWQDKTVQQSTRVSIALAFFGVLCAVLIGLFLRR